MFRIATSQVRRSAAPIALSVWATAGFRANSLTKMSARTISTSLAKLGERRGYKEHSRYPVPRSRFPEKPADKVIDELLDSSVEIPKGEDLMESIKITDDEINKIYDAIMPSERRREIDNLSIEHRSHAEVLKMRRERKERIRFKGKQPNDETDNKNNKDTEAGKEKGENKSKATASGKATISDGDMERLIYMDTRSVREMTEAMETVIASVDSASIERLSEKVQSVKEDKNELNEAINEQGLVEVNEDEDHDVSLLASELSIDEFNYVIFANSLAGNADKAMSAYELMKEAGIKPDQRTFANLTVAYTKAGDLETAVSMFKRLNDEDLTPNIYSFGTLIRAYMEFDRVDDAFKVYEDMKAQEIWPNLPVYNSLIVSSLKVGDFKRAWGVFEHMRYTISRPDVVAFSIMIHACAKNGEVEKAMNLFDEMIQLNLTLTDVTFNSLIHACAVRSDYFDEAFRMLQLMEARGFQPDYYTYNTLIYACSRKRNLELARSIFRDLLEKTMDPKNKGLLRIDSVTITNMLWCYSSARYSTKPCTWGVAKKYEKNAMKALADVKAAKEHQSDLPRLLISDVSSKFIDPTKQNPYDSIREKTRLAFLDASNADQESDETNKKYMHLIDTIMPEKVPPNHNAIGSEASRLMVFYVETLKGDVTQWLLNAYISTMCNNGRFYEAWLVFLGEFERFNIKKNGWTFQFMIRLCARTRDIPSAWRVWDEFKAWRADVERELGTPGYENMSAETTMVYRREQKSQAQNNDDSNDSGSSATGNGESKPHGDEMALNQASMNMLALAEGLEFPGENAMPDIVGGGALAIIPADRELARRKIGCGMKTEHVTYLEMINLLGSCDDFRSAIHLIREEINGIPEHPHRPTLQDVNRLYQHAIRAGNKHAALDIRGLCMVPLPHSARRSLHSKWGTSFTWEVPEYNQRSLSRRFPEEFRRHQAPFKNGEYVYSRSRKDRKNRRA